MQASGLETAVKFLPAVNATLNGTAAVLLVTGYRLIRTGRINAHHNVMIAAFTTSVLFLLSYLIYHGVAGAVYFGGTGLVRYLYLTILTTHTILAATVPFLAVITLRRALRRDFARHQRIARWT